MNRDITRIAGLVLAAGYSHRMGEFKPLLPFGSSTAIERVVGCFLEAGVQDVGVVVGWRAKELLPMLSQLGAKAVFNPDYDSGMYSSVVAGVRSLRPQIEAFLLLPADYPLVKPETVRRLSECYLSGKAGIVYPRFMERRGHPPLVERKYVENDTSLGQSGGLRAVLRQHEDAAMDVDVDDRGVVMDIDTPDDYRKALALLGLLSP